MTSSASPQIRLAKNCKLFIHDSSSALVDICCEKILINNQVRCFVGTVDETGTLKVWDMLAVETHHKLLYQISLAGPLANPSPAKCNVSILRIPNNIIVFGTNKSANPPSMSLYIINDVNYKQSMFDPIKFTTPHFKVLLPLKSCYNFHLDFDENNVKRGYLLGVKDSSTNGTDNGNSSSSSASSDEISFMEISSLQKAQNEGEDHVVQISKTFKNFSASSQFKHADHQSHHVELIYTADGSPVAVVNEGEKVKFYASYSDELILEVSPSFATFSSSNTTSNPSRKPFIKYITTAFEHDEEYETTSSSSARGSGESAREGRSSRRTVTTEEKEPPTAYVCCVIGDDNGPDEIVTFSSQHKTKDPIKIFVDESDKRKKLSTSSASSSPAPSAASTSSKSSSKKRKREEKNEAKESKKIKKSEKHKEKVQDPIGTPTSIAEVAPQSAPAAAPLPPAPRPPIHNFTKIDDKLSFKVLPRFTSLSPVTKLCYSHKGDMVLSLNNVGESQVLVWPTPDSDKFITLSTTPMEFPNKEMAFLKCEQKFWLQSAFVPQVLVLAKNDQYIVVASGGPLTLCTNKSPTQTMRKMMATLSTPNVEEKCVSAFDFDRNDNNLFVLGCMNGEITIRKNANPKGVHNFMASPKPIFDVKLLPKKVLITADADGNVKIWHWNSLVPPGANATKFTCDVKYEIPGNGEHDNVNIIVTPSKPLPTTGEQLSDTQQDTDTFIIKRSGLLQIWDVLGNPGSSWFPEGNPPGEKGKINEDAIVIKDAKYSANGDLVYVLLSDDSIRILSNTLVPLYSTSPISSIIHKASSPALLLPSASPDDDTMAIDHHPVMTCISVNPQNQFQFIFGSTDSNITVVEINLSGGGGSGGEKGKS